MVLFSLACEGRRGEYVFLLKFCGEAKHLFDRLIKWLNDLNPRQLLILAGVVMLVMFSSIYFFLSWWVADKDDEKKN